MVISGAKLPLYLFITFERHNPLYVIYLAMQQRKKTFIFAK